MFHLAAYVGASGGIVTNQDTPAITDTVLGIRNNHFILQYPMVWQWLYSLGASLSQSRIFSPTLSAYGYPQVWPLDTAGAVLPLANDLPAVVDYWPRGIHLPLEEELAWQVTTTSATTERDALLAWFCTPDHSLQLASGALRLVIQATYTVTPGAIYTWTNAGQLTFQQNLRGGWWGVNGMWVQDAAALAARIIFPNPPTYLGMPLRPGCIVQPAVGNRPWWRQQGQLGQWGFFNTVVPMVVEILPSTTGARTGTVMLDLTYIGQAAPHGYR